MVLRIYNPHSDPRYPANDLRLRGVNELTNAAWRKGMGNQSELISVQFTPGTGITAPKLHEIDRPVVFRSPGKRVHAFYTLVNLDEGTGSQ